MVSAQCQTKDPLQALGHLLACTCGSDMAGSEIRSRNPKNVWSGLQGGWVVQSNGCAAHSSSHVDLGPHSTITLLSRASDHFQGGQLDALALSTY
jgi:hypothetical protein